MKGWDVKLGRRFLIAAAMLLTCATWMGCSADRKYKVLSFFFDGVPDPNAPVVAQADEGVGSILGPSVRPTGVPLFVHKPFADNNCNGCHGGDVSAFAEFANVTSAACMNCHKTARDQYPVMHGPVAVGECLLCHLPHESEYAHLLRSPSPALCTQCHERDLLSPNPQEHLSPTADCLNCHFGHGGPAHKLLRTSASATTRPATAPAEGGGRS